MEEANNVLTIELHYFMDKQNRHEMDAVIHNRCDASIINVINNLADIIGEDIQLNFSTSTEGGVKDKFKLIIKKGIPHDIFIALVSALIAHFISVAPSMDESQKQLNRAELIEKFKQGDFTEDEINFVLSGDKKYIENRNDFYRNLDKEPHVTKVQCYPKGAGISENQPVPEIEKKYFLSQIVTEHSHKESVTYKGTSVMVLVPILSKESKAKWKGLFNNQVIPFTIADKVFLKEVFDKEVHFVAGTSLRCDFTVVTEIEYDLDGVVISDSRTGIVDNVTSCYDGEVLVHNTKRYRKKKEEERQLSLFNYDDLDKK